MLITVHLPVETRLKHDLFNKSLNINEKLYCQSRLNILYFKV